ncbi:hypothetical protein [Pseudomonas putida]
MILSGCSALSSGYQETHALSDDKGRFERLLSIRLSDEEKMLITGLDTSEQLRGLVVHALGSRLSPSSLSHHISAAPGDDSAPLSAHPSFSENTLKHVRQMYLTGRLPEGPAPVSHSEESAAGGFVALLESLSPAAREAYLESEIGTRAYRSAVISAVARRFVKAEAARELLSIDTDSISLQFNQRKLIAALMSGERKHDAELKRVVEATSTAARLLRESVANLRSSSQALQLETGCRHAPVLKDSRRSVVVAPTTADWPGNVPVSRIYARFDLQLLGSGSGAASAQDVPTQVEVAENTSPFEYLSADISPFVSRLGQTATMPLPVERPFASEFKRFESIAYQEVAGGFRQRNELIARLHSQSPIDDLAREQLATRRELLLKGEGNQLDVLKAQSLALQTERAMVNTRLLIKLNLLSIYDAMNGAKSSVEVFRNHQRG